MVSEVKRFFIVLLIVEIFVILTIAIPTFIIYFALKYLGSWGLLVVACSVIPYLAALADYIRRNQ
jgi:predicted PurR-regulated permease PerM